jgi:hypothetical protein
MFSEKSKAKFFRRFLPKMMFCKIDAKDETLSQIQKQNQ